MDYQEEPSEEEKILEAEIEKIKENLDDARLNCQDTSFYDKTEHIEPIPQLKLRFKYNLKAHSSKVVSLDWCTDSQRLVTVAQDGLLIIWDTLTRLMIEMLSLSNNWVMSCCYSPNQTQVVTGDLSNDISLYDPTVSKTPILMMSEHLGYISYLQNSDSDKLISSSADKTCKLWDLEVGKSICSFLGHTDTVLSLNVSKSNPNIFVSCSSDKTCLLWDTRIAKKFVQVFVGHSADVTGVSFFPESSLGFVSGSEDSKCRLWDIRSDQCLAMYYHRNIKSSVNSVSHSKSGRLIIAGYEDFNCRLWDLLCEQCVGIMSHHEDQISAVKTSPSGYAIAVASYDKSCSIWTNNK